jgi:hypothetical protein
MPTSAQIAARKAALAKVKDGFNAAATASDTAADALAPIKESAQTTIVAFNKVGNALIAAKPVIAKEIELTDAMVPSDPPPVDPPQSPVITPSPDRTRGARIVMDNKDVWTLGPPAPNGFQLLLNGQWTGGGIGVEFLKIDNVAHVRITGDAWFKWDGAWRTEPDPTIEQPPVDPPPPVIIVPPPPGTVPVVVGEWVPLTVAPYKLRDLSGIKGDGRQDFDPSISRIVEALPLKTVSTIPHKAFVRPVLVWIDGKPALAYFGGLHSNWPGNEIHFMFLPTGIDTEIKVELSGQPHVPPYGRGSGYGSGSSEYIHRQYDGPFNGDDSEPYSGHNWTGDFDDPEYGYCAQITGWSGAMTPEGLPIPTGDKAVVCFNPRGEKRWRTRNPDWIGRSGASDFNQFRHSHVFAEINRSWCTINEWTSGRGVRVVGTYLFGGRDASSGNGVLMQWLEGSRHLMLGMDDSGKDAPPPETALTKSHRLALLNLEGTQPLTGLAIPEWPFEGIPITADGNLTFYVWRTARKVLYMVFGAGRPIRFFLAPFENLTDWKEIKFKTDVLLPSYRANFLAVCRQPGCIVDDYLFMMNPDVLGNPNPENFLDGANTWMRAKLTDAEMLP